MNNAGDYEFEWDDAKGAANLHKHDVDFMEAMTVLTDPLAMTFFDSEHSDDEDRWITLGRSINGGLLLVIHTFLSIEQNSAQVRLISARLATKRERKQYETGLSH